jgi:predicted DNA-binding protein
VKNKTFATKLSADLVRDLDSVCDTLGLRKNFVVEEALREKIEDLMDAHDLRQAVKEATGFHSLDSVRRELK